MPISAEEINEAFRAKIKTLVCPHCDTLYSDFAADWGDAWHEGRRDLMNELNGQERDGPYKLKCELCGGKAWTNAFLTAPTPA